MDTWFRLRHLQAISARNVNTSIKDLNWHFIFFALSTTDNENLGYFYQSSKCDNLLNPFWENIDLSYDTIKRFSYLDNFIITFFLNKNTKNKILLEIKVHISGLKLFTKLTSSNLDDDNQLFLFQFNNNFYYFDATESPDLLHGPSNEIPVKIKKKIYNVETIKRFLTLVSDENQQITQNIVAKRKNLEKEIFQYKSKICRINQIKNRICALRSHISLEQKIRNRKVKELSDIKKSITIFRDKISRNLENQEKTEVDIAKLNTSLKRHRELYLKISNDYMLRMYQLIHELSKIFPITPTDWPNPTNTGDNQPTTINIRSTDKLSICNLHLPNNDKQITLNQEPSIFAALGMVCQLLGALSKIYDIPLRYTLITHDPKTAIRDDIIDIDDSERNFLLVKSTAPGFRLQYAVYLLNLNIAAIRGYFSLSTKSPDRTLWNINTLIEGKNRVVESGSVELGSSNNLAHSAQINSNNSPKTTKSVNNVSPLVTKSFSVIN